MSNQTIDPRYAARTPQGGYEISEEDYVNDTNMKHEFNAKTHGRLALNSLDDNVFVSTHERRKRRIKRMSDRKVIRNMVRGVGALVVALAILGVVAFIFN